MRQPLTTRQQEIVDLAGSLALEFGERAAEHDRDATFPFENYDRMRDAGYLGLTVPEELGGRGASLYELLLAQERLATGCSATALAVNMHVSPIGQLAILWRRTGDPNLEQSLRDAAAGRTIYAAMTAERGHSVLMDSHTIAERVDGGFRVTGDKIFGTESAVCTQFTSMARYEDPVTGPRVLFFRIPRDSDGMTVKQTWDTMGMRGTQSNDFRLDGVFVPEDAVFHSFPVGHFDAIMLKTVWCWAQPSFGAVYLGIGLGAMEYAREQAIKRGTASSPQIQQLFAEMEILLETARAVLYRHAAEVEADLIADRLEVQEGMARAVLAKYVAGNHAAQIVDKAMHVVGGSGYYRRSPLERMYRDVRAGTIMPANNVEAFELIGRTAVGIEVAPAIPLAESGPNSLPREPAGELRTWGRKANPVAADDVPAPA
jgi:alkylation response protein AidB-like acyl-CoA dehydrogenase